MTFNNTQKFLVGTLAFVLVAGMTSPAFAQTIPSLAVDVVSPPDNQGGDASGSVSSLGAVPTDNSEIWFRFLAPNTDAIAAIVNSPTADTPWTFDCGSNSCWVTVEDRFIVGDQFNVYDFGDLVGTTSVPDPDFSEGIFCFGPGAHSMTIQDIIDDDLYPGEAVFSVEQHDTLDCGEEPRPVAGELLAIDSSALVIGGLTSSAVWMIPTLAGIAGAGIYLVKLRTNRD